jgi:hypothetical protein
MQRPAEKSTPKAPPVREKPQDVCYLIDEQKIGQGRNSTPKSRLLRPFQPSPDRHQKQDPPRPTDSEAQPVATTPLALADQSKIAQSSRAAAHHQNQQAHSFPNPRRKGIYLVWKTASERDPNKAEKSV